MITFNDFIREYNLEIKARTNAKVCQILCSIGLNNVGIYLRDRPFESDIGIKKFASIKRNSMVCYINENYFDSYGCVPPQKLSKFNIIRNGYCLYSEYQIQKTDSFRASICLYILYLTKV